ncbi:hypothetical protein DACRYDRAFT_105571 [Dacryopinax primogenitus]|uniref:Uncharacterized protein n=1 Tax=Dacryopinax primogenitus (strain DJM 731) TaxID=1858805 RepID=M5G717_DACPD|nr:uncharacterized protein DACRYDRAFT_105571 [Dacryopinax primogenitus]EJU04514.1 hypothetical protein DACRYDRAFT_105571 [Dacryopinax primogenitus]
MRIYAREGYRLPVSPPGTRRARGGGSSRGKRASAGSGSGYPRGWGTSPEGETGSVTRTTGASAWKSSTEVSLGWRSPPADRLGAHPFQLGQELAEGIDTLGLGSGSVDAFSNLTQEQARLRSSLRPVIQHTAHDLLDVGIPYTPFLEDEFQRFLERFGQLPDLHAGPESAEDEEVKGFSV